MDETIDSKNEVPQVDELGPEDNFLAAQAQSLQVQRDNIGFIVRSIAKVNAEFSVIEHEFNRLSSEYYKQERRIQDVKRKLYTLNERKIQDFIKQYAKPASRQLANKFINYGFPREIRDRVYEFYWEEHRTMGNNGASMDVLLERWKINCPVPFGECQCHRGRHYARPILINPEYVGVDVAREGLEYFYFAYSPKVLPSVTHIERYLNSDMLGLGTTPGMGIRRLAIHINMSSTVIPEKCTHKGGKRYFVGSLADNFAALSNISKKHGFKLGFELQFFEKFTALALIESILDHIAPTFYLFKGEGAQVQVGFKWNTAFNDYPVLRPSFRFEMGEYFSLDRDQWGERFKNDVMVWAGDDFAFNKYITT